SSLTGARVNFAIAVNRVRKFLEEPALILHNPHITFLEHTKFRQFKIDAYAFDRRTIDDLQVELSLSSSGDEPRTLKARRVGDHFVAEGPACSPSEVPAKSLIVVSKGRGQIQSELPAGNLSIGGRKFPWRDVDSLIKDGGEWIVTLLNGECYAGTPVDL